MAQTDVIFGLQDGDAVAIFNFRSDRVIEISKAFEYEDFSAFDRKRFPKACMHPRCHAESHRHAKRL